jgi:tRNA (guanine-N7-)-methyltransferase
MPDQTPSARRTIRCIVRRNGRITGAQQRALDELWPRFGIHFEPHVAQPAQWFGRQAPCTLEIGFGNGEHLRRRAAAEPQRNFIGIEVHRSGVGHLLNEAGQLGLGNLRVLCHDAVEVLRAQLAPGCLDEVQILFPDPWPKARHHKRRLIQPGFVTLLAGALRPGGMLHLATDWAPYAEHMGEVLAASSQFAASLPDEGQPTEWVEARAPTRFESRGLRLGHAIADLYFRRTG